MPNKQYFLHETSTTWTDTTGDLALTFNNLAAATGMRQGATKDLGAVTTARSLRFYWSCYVEFAIAATVGDVVEIYGKTGDGTVYDNDDGTGDIAVSSTDKLKNLTVLGRIVVDQAATSVKMRARGSILLPDRHFMPVVVNLADQALVATNNVSKFILSPTPFELQ